MEESEKYKRAKQRVEAQKSFYVHLLVYVLVNLWLFVLDLITMPGEWWFYWPLIGWGIGLTAHGLAVLVGEGPLGKGWEEKKIRETMAKERPEDTDTR